MKRPILTIAVLIFCFLGLSGWSPAAERTVETEGSSAISKQDAVKQAQRAAIEEGVGVFLQSETEIENFALKKDVIFSNAEGYVTRFTILKESIDGGIFNVKIRATVSLDKIKDDLIAMKILLESMERPSLMVLINESYSNMQDLGLGIAAAELSSILIDKGFDLVDQAQIKKVAALSETRQALAGDINAAQSLGLRFGSQYVIVGKAAVQGAGKAYKGSRLESFRATIQAKVIQTQTGLLLGSTVKSGAGVHLNPLAGGTMALQKAAKKLTDEYLVDAITNSFQNYLNNGTPLKLHISGVNSFRRYKSVAAAVQSLQNVSSSKKEGWNKTGGLLVLDLRFKGTSEDLAELIDGLRIKQHKLEVVDFAPQRVDCVMR